MLIPGSRGRPSIAAVHNLKWRIRRVAGEILVGKYLDPAGMVHRQKLYLIEVDGFFERFHEAETELAVLLAQRSARHFEVLRGPWKVTLVGPNPVPNHARAQHVSNQLVVGAVPGE